MPYQSSWVSVLYVGRSSVSELQLGAVNSAPFFPPFTAILTMLSTFETNFQRRRDVEQFAIDVLDSKLKRDIEPIGEAELHCQGYAGGGNPPHDIVIWCRVTITKRGKLRSDFKLNGRRIAAHKIALRLGELGA